VSARHVELDCLPADLPDAAALSAAVAGARLVCFPTDTVYGVGGALSPATLAAIVAAKGRAPGKPLQVIFPTVAALLAAVACGPRLGGALRRLLPGPVTAVVPYPAGWRLPPPGELDGLTTLGVRVPAWPRRARLRAPRGAPLLASSANRSGEEPAAGLAAVDPALLAACDLLLDGGEVDGRSSSVVDLTRYEVTGAWRILREGAWGFTEVAGRLGAQEE
jgi:L-threonylcarbamoyladenylate synthase